METQKCVLYDRDCIGCMECEMCDLDPNKICDNCGKCLERKKKKMTLIFFTFAKVNVIIK